MRILSVTALAVCATVGLGAAALAAPTQRTEMAPVVTHAEPQVAGYWFCVDTMYRYGLRRGYDSDLSLLAAADVCGRYYVR